MKLTKNKLRDLIKEVLSEREKDSLILTESEVSLELDRISAMLADTSSKSQLQRVGIMTAENPRGMPSNKQSNMQSMMQFKAALDKKGLDYVSMGGRYGSPENSVFILNPSKLDVIEMGKTFGQAAVIFGQRLKRNYRKGQDSVYFRMDYYQTQPDGEEDPDYGPQEYYLIDSRDMVVADASAQAKEDYYSEIGGKKFYIPFFSDKPEHEMSTEPGAQVFDKESELKSYGIDPES